MEANNTDLLFSGLVIACIALFGLAVFLKQNDRAR